MRRTEYYYDPGAPRANSIVVAATAFVLNGIGELLLIRRSDNGLWALPGGAQDIGEYIAETAVRETREETGIEIHVTDLVGISNPNHVIAYADGEVRQQFSICFRAHRTGGEPRTSCESTDVRWVPPTELDQLPIHESTRLRITHGYEDRQHPFID